MSTPSAHTQPSGQPVPATTSAILMKRGQMNTANNQLNRDVIQRACSTLKDLATVGVFAAKRLDAPNWLTGPIDTDIEAPDFAWLMLRMPSLLRNFSQYAKMDKDAYVYNIASDPSTMKPLSRALSTYSQFMGEAFDEHAVILAYHSTRTNRFEFVVHATRKQPLTGDNGPTESYERFLEDLVGALSYSYDAALKHAGVIPPSLYLSVRSSIEDDAPMYGHRREED